MNWIIKLFLATLFIISNSIHAANSEDWDVRLTSPEEVVKRYIKLDGNGAWLSAKGREDLSQLMTSEIHLVHEISAQVVKGYKLLNVEIIDGKALAMVEYDAIGETHNFAILYKDVKKEIKNIKVIKDGRYWLIDEYNQPYMLADIVIKHIKSKQDKSKMKFNKMSLDKKRKYKKRHDDYIGYTDDIINAIKSELNQ